MAENPPSPLSRGAPLLAARLVVPAPPAVTVTRSRLHALLDQGTAGPVTVVAAPPGWGKTVLLSSWARAAAQHGRTAWLTVEAGDDARFWSYLHAALSAVTGGGDAFPPAPADDSYPTRLAHALARLPEPVVVVLDDLHELHDSTIFADLSFVVRHAAGRLRLVVAARSQPPLPLHRWRLSGELTELRTAQLAFNEAETGELLGRHGLGLPDTHVRDLWRRTEGWPAGLRIAALAARGHLEPATAAGEFGGDDPRVEEYLRGEVLSRHPPAVVDVLVDTSVLEWLSAGLVEAVTGRTDSARLLAELERKHGLLVPIGFRPPTYRYYRPVGEFLSAELGRRAPERIPALHRRAARWLADDGRPAEALRHWLAGGDREGAVEVLRTHWPVLVLCRDLGAHAGTWPGVTPPSAEQLHSDPDLALALAAEALDRRDPASADDYLRVAGHPPEASPAAGPQPSAAAAAGLRLGVAALRGDTQGVRRAASRLIARAGPGPDQAATAVALTVAGCADLHAGDLDAADAALRQGAGAAARARLACPRLISTSHLAYLHASRGCLTAAGAAVDTVRSLPGCRRHRTAVHLTQAHLAAALVDIRTDHLADASRHLAMAAAGVEVPGDPVLAASVGAVRVELCYEYGELDEAYHVLAAARRDLADPPRSPYLWHRLVVLEAEIRTACDDPRTARNLLMPLSRPDAPGTATAAVALARAHLRDGDPTGADRALPPWDGPRSDELPPVVRVDAALQAAAAAAALGDERRCGQAVERALRLAEPEGLRRLFTGAGSPPGTRELLTGHLDSGTAHWMLVKELISATSGADPTASGHTVAPEPTEPLTERELIVLRYLQSILSTAEIAAELHLSVNTVKTHLRHIYRKLRTSGRRATVRRARELRLL